MEQIIYVVTEYFPNTNDEPIVTLFDNKKNAKSCFEYYKSVGRIVSMDKCPLYKTFEVLYKANNRITP